MYHAVCGVWGQVNPADTDGDYGSNTSDSLSVSAKHPKALPVNLAKSANQRVSMLFAYLIVLAAVPIIGSSLVRDFSSLVGHFT